MILDVEFKRFKTLEIREGIRREYDNLRSKLDVFEGQIKKQKENPTMEKGDIARLDDQKVIIERDVKQMLDQLSSLDLEVEGSKKTHEYPEGLQGINQQLDALHELQEMIKSYMENVL